MGDLLPITGVAVARFLRVNCDFVLLLSLVPGDLHTSNLLFQVVVLAHKSISDILVSLCIISYHDCSLLDTDLQLSSLDLRVLELGPVGLDVSAEIVDNLDLFLKGNAGRFKVLDFDISLVNLRVEVLCPRGTGSVTDLDRLFNSLRLFDWGSRFLRWHFNDG